MRYREFVREYQDLNQEKDAIIQTVSGLNASNETEAKLLDRIWKILNSETVTSKIDTAFSASLGDESFAKAQKAKVLRDVTQIISNLTADFKAMSGFLDSLEKGTAVNIGELSKPLSSFEQVFNGNSVTQEAFYALASYGSGKKQKGPGEYALAILSPKIALRAGGGDLDIQGMGQVELKASIDKSGGRLGHGGMDQKTAKDILKKYHNDVPALKQHFEDGAKSMGLGKFVEYLNIALPVSIPDNQKLRMEIAADLYKPTFSEHAKGIVQAFGQEDIKTIENEYLRANYEHYLARDYFDVLLLCSFAMKKFAAVRSADELLKLKNDKHLAAISLSAVPTAAGAREVYSQMSLTGAKF